MSDERQRTVNLPAEKAPILAEADVVVVGGGTSGFIAAVAAARTGARTVLVERFGYLGGCTTTTYNTGVSAFGDSDGQQIIRGIPWEFAQRMLSQGNAQLGDGRNPYRLSLWPTWTKVVANEMVLEARVEVWMYAWASGVLKRGGLIQGLVVQTKGGRGVILGKAFVDASGDADVAAFAGAPYDMTEVEHLQQVSCDYMACGVDWRRVVAWAQANPDKIERASGLDLAPAVPGAALPMVNITLREEHKLASDGARIGVEPTVKLCLHREAVRLQGNVEIDPLDPKALTYAEMEGLRGALRHLAYLRETMPGFEDAYLVSQSHLGVRETRRIIGDYVITIDDLQGQARFEDVVAKNCRGLDYHLKGTVFKYTGLKGHHDIPLRALLPQGVDNLTVCGRSISCDHASQASLRGAITCMATGHAAGTAAALAAMGDGRVRGLTMRQVQDKLVEQDAVLWL